MDTLRDRMEAGLVARLSPHVRAVGAWLRPKLASIQDRGFGSAYLAYLLYCTGHGAGSRSSRFPSGLVYVDESAAIGIGCFVTKRGGAVHLVGPAGPDALSATSRIARAIEADYPSVRIYARHLAPEQAKSLLGDAEWGGIDEAPWLDEAPQEDETYHSRCVVLERLLDPSSPQTVRCLRGQETGNFRRKARLAYNRFRNFLDRNGARYVLRPHDATNVPEVCELIEAHFEDVASRRRPIGSSAGDYRGIATFVPEPGTTDVISRVGILVTPTWQRTVSFFAAEALSAAAFGCYSMITRRSATLLPRSADRLGFSAISQYALIRFLRVLLQAGAREVDVGGSETPELDRFKRQLGAAKVPSHWAVFRGSRSKAARSDRAGWHQG